MLFICDGDGCNALFYPMNIASVKLLLTSHDPVVRAQIAVWTPVILCCGVNNAHTNNWRAGDIIDQ